MTSHTQQQPLQQEIEKNYINSLLNVDVDIDLHQQIKGIPEIIDTPISITSSKAPPVTHPCDIATDNLYQLVSVDGLKLAIPLSEITQVVNDTTIIIKGKRLFHQEEQFNIVSMGALISGKDNDVNMDMDIEAETANKQFLLIQHRQLAIECQKIDQIETIDKNIVCWRNENSQRKWLAGTVKQMGVAILDMTELQLLINKSGRIKC
jgi:hypothetical protein